MITQVIHLEADDDITTVRARLEKAEARRVLLVVPPGCQAFDSLLDLKLLQRYAESLALEVALVTKASKTRVLARQLGFSVFISTKRGQKVKWRRPKAIPRWGSRLGWGERIFAAFVFVVALSALLASALLIVPSAEIILLPAGEAVNATLQVEADPELEMINYGTGQIPARVVQAQIEGTAQIPTTGTKDAPDEPARGKVLFVNKINQIVTVPKGTVVATSTGSTIRFTTVADVTLPETVGGTVEGEVVALDPGPGGNVGANLINSIEGSLSLQVKVTNPEQMRGGSVKQVGMVTTADKERLKAVLLQQLQQGVQARLSEQLREEEFLSSESVAVDHIVTEMYDKVVEEQADVLTLEMEVMFSGIAIDEEDANALVEAALKAKVRDGFVLASQGLEYQRGEVTSVEDGKVSYVVRGSGSAMAQIDVNAVKEAIRGRPLDWAEDYLSQGLRLKEAPIIKVTPTWPGQIPWLGFRISISVQEE